MNSKLNILYLEDNIDDFELAKTILEEDGIIDKIVWVKNQVDFENSLKNNRYDLVLADFNLPEFDGLSAIKIIKESYTDTPVIILSGELGEEQAIDTLKEGASDYVLKQRISRLIPAIQRTITETVEKSKRKLAEEALRKEEEKYRSLTENINIGVYRNTIGPNGMFIEINPAFVKMFGYNNKEEVLALNVADLYIKPEERVRFNDKIQKNGFVKNEEVLLKKKNGDEIYCSVFAAAVFDKKGNFKYFDGVIEDITERKNALEQIKKDLKEKEVLLAEIHHRVKNNMQIISGLLYLQSRYVADEKTLKMLQQSQDRIQSLSLVHENLYQSDYFSEIDIANYINDITSLLYQTYELDRNKIKCKIEAKNIFMRIEDAMPFGILINEIVSNSLKHAFPNSNQGNINILFEKNASNDFVLKISDDGIGMPEEISFEKPKSFGLELIKMLSEDQFGGNVTINRNNGTLFQIIWKKAN